MSLVAKLKGTGPTGFGYGSTAEDVIDGVDLAGKNILVTGSNSGLGLETMRVLAARGARVFGAARTDEKAERACEGVAGDTVPVVCELSEPESVSRCAAEVTGHSDTLDAIICNAGIMALPELQQKFGYELQFFTNHVGHFILITELLDHLADDGRVVLLSSDAHKAAPRSGIQFDNLSGEKGYSSWAAYGQSKLANLLCARELARRFEGTRRTANAIHPGVIATNLGRHMNPIARAALKIGEPLFLKSAAQGASTQTYVAAHPDAATISGEYWADCNVARSSSNGQDSRLARRLWEESERIVDELR
jgi:WW domain-containing oxidoreductase